MPWRAKKWVGKVPNKLRPSSLRTVPGSEEGYSTDEGGGIRTVYDDYTIIKEIGVGAFSRVYKGIQIATGAEVAIKVIATASRSRRVRRVIENEVRAMEKIRDELSDHAELFCQIHEVIRGPKRTCIVMEYLEGGELFDKIISQPEVYSEDDVRDLMLRTLKSVKLLHSIGIVHRDLKPENLCFATNQGDSLKVMDFGLALVKGLGDANSYLSYVGSPGYAAPEVMLSRSYGPQNDVWSLGVIMFILLCGKMPFGGPDSEMQRINVLAGRYTMDTQEWKLISEEAKDLVRKMLTVDVKDRITVDEALIHGFFGTPTPGEEKPHLEDTLTEMRKTNARMRWRLEVERALAYATTELRKSLEGLLLRNNSQTELTVQSLKNIATLQASRGQNSVTREEFVKFFTDIGMEHLPLEEIFNVLAEQAAATGGLPLNDPDNEDGVAAERVEIDELLIGLVVIGAAESRDKAYEALFNFLTDFNEGALGGQALGKIVRVFASYAPPDENLDEANRRRHIANSLTGLFYSDEDEEVPVTYESFKNGLERLGLDVVNEFVIAPVQSFAESARLGQHRATRKFTEYLRHMTAYVMAVNRSYRVASNATSKPPSDHDAASEQEVGI
mmetsp:Transcript_10763/g.18994  ORF Transcript_10763/g.18994 Transcript_10763/m.18994 type:complete len:615 (-) Transcript_10763:594-2438(-)|eukprot:CAMPEP_0184522586 /NCGR_PEP_ID=MMETSP0198_2-20121128/8363_1 /TAXON_ID=1112570 /ORGANISM="Thraustochytrium sp., Strain LLF1b" /LENGTH=614 /DNA_ID=CAMNT_0026913427 /DNA_START=306 /DNA_END=2150 /DNA_ORIENTATION=+